MKYADRRGFRLALIVGENEAAKGVCQVKVMATGETVEVPIFNLAGDLAKFLER